MSDQVEFFFDVSSPWTCLAFHNIQPMMQTHAFSVRWRPFLVGGVHNQVNPTVAEARASGPENPKWRQVGRSLYDWAALAGIAMNFPRGSQWTAAVAAISIAFAVSAEDNAALEREVERGRGDTGGCGPAAMGRRLVGRAGMVCSRRQGR